MKKILITVLALAPFMCLWSQKRGSISRTAIRAASYESPTLSSSENYIYTRAFQVAVTDASQISELGDVIEQVTYFDGLGRPKQQLAIQASPLSNDIVTYNQYDALGRSPKSYLPYVAINQSSGFIQSDPLTKILEFYNVPKYQNTTNPYSETIYESSPLGRVLEQGAPGASWEVNPLSDGDNTVKFEYLTNTRDSFSSASRNSTDDVYYFEVTFSGGNTALPILQNGTLYPPGVLFKNITKDENWNPSSGKNHTTEEFTNKIGQTILKRTYDNDVAHDTYYVYDNFGNLTFVLPPEVTSVDGTVSSFERNALAYQYRYDARNRLIEKKIPGKGWEHIVYNKLDQPIMTRDENLKDQGRWLFTKYDAFGRVTYTGLVASTGSRAVMQNAANLATTQVEERSNAISLGGTSVRYTNSAYPNTNITKLHTVSYYDSYTDTAGLSLPSLVYGVSTNVNTKSLPTVSKVRVLDTNHWITTITGYDSKSRTIYNKTKNTFLATTDEVKIKLDFAGKIDETSTVHTKSGEPSITSIDTYTYDHLGRQLAHKQRLNNQSTEELIAQNSYDDLGQLQNKKVGHTASLPLQEVNYKYNVRGWLTDINDVDQEIANATDLFNFRINYDDVDRSTYDNVTNLYNGNIAQTTWKSLHQDKTKRSYRYAYDHLNRIKDAYSYRKSGGNESDPATTPDAFNLRSISYDKNGNILELERYTPQNSRPTKMDDLLYAYTGNKLLRVTELATGFVSDLGFKDGSNSGSDYLYDDNGNMTRDLNKGISSITYNHLNLPTSVSITSSQGAGTGIITYVYDATGVKLKKTVQNTTENTIAITQYAGDKIYKQEPSNTGLQMIFQPEGYVEPDGSGGFKYVYQYKDHLGNVRLTYADTNGDGSINPATEIISEKNYYPFGLKHKGYNNVISGTHHPYDYQGKENQEELGLNWHDFGARNYDAALGRWMNTDPLSEDFYSYSPYNAMMNDPIGYIDPDGRSAEWVPGTDGKAITYSEDANGNLTVSDNATADTQQIVAGINESGSETAKSQFKGVADSEGKVNLVVNKTDTGANGKSLNGLHQPHDANGNALNWDSSTQSFDGVAETFVDSNGNTVYNEATITIFESNFNDDSKNKFGVMGKTGVWDSGLTKSNTMTGTFSHEVDHNLNQNTVQAVKDRGNGIPNSYSVEPPAYKVQKQVHQEIKDNRKN